MPRSDHPTLPPGGEPGDTEIPPPKVSQRGSKRIRSNLDLERRRVVHVAEGELTAWDIRSVVLSTFHEGAFTPDMDIVWDLREADLSQVDLPDVRDVADLVREVWVGEQGRTAVVTATSADFGVGRQFTALTQGLPRVARTFSSWDAAMAWLQETAASVPADAEDD